MRNDITLYGLISREKGADGEIAMDRKIVFFKRYCDTGEIQVASITKEDLQNVYGHTEIHNGMLLTDEDDFGNPAEEVVELVEDGLARKWEAVENLEQIFIGTEPFLLNFINELMAKVHTFCHAKDEDLALTRRIKTSH